MRRDEEILLWVLGAVIVLGGITSTEKVLESKFKELFGGDGAPRKGTTTKEHTLLPAKKTPASWTDVSGAFAAAWRNGFSKMPTREELAMALAHTALETGRWQHMYNYNAGNITTSQRGYFMLPGNARHFAAYPDLVSGAGAFVSLLSRRYPTAFAAMATGDVGQYVIGLYHGDRGQSYCPDCDAAELTDSLHKLYSEFRGLLGEARQT